MLYPLSYRGGNNSRERAAERTIPLRHDGKP